MRPDRKIIRRVKKHDQRAQLQLYKQCFSTMMGVAVRYKKNRDDAAVLVNEAFLRVLTYIDTYDFEKPFDAWIRRIVINCAIDDFKKNQKHKEFFKETENQENLSIESSSNLALEQMELEEIEEKLRILPKATHLVFNLYALDGYSHDEVAEKLGITRETSKWHVREARKKLREIFAKISIYGSLIMHLTDIL